MKNKNLWNSIQIKKPQKSKFDLTHDVKMSCNMGELVPICNVEVLPGDTFHISNQNLIRLAPMLAPIMQRIDVFTHYFFVPNRILWEKWETFITNDPSSTPVHPYLTITPELAASKKRFGNFMGLASLPSGAAPIEVNALPFAAYNRIYNDYYRDQNLQNPLVDTLFNGSNDISLFMNIKNRAWEHDYFTSSLPFAQKGAAVNLPIGSVHIPYQPIAGKSANYGVNNRVQSTVSGDYYNVEAAPSPLGNGFLYSKGGSYDVGNTTINDLRRAYSLQKFLEKNARAGTRYVESLLAHFFVKAQDSRLQRAEYICGSKSPVSVSEVLNTTGTSTLPQGNMSGHGFALTQGNNGTYHAQEHGWIIGIQSVLPKPSYQQGVPKNFLKANFIDYAFPEFANIGEQPVLNKELYVASSDPNGIFGYVPRYSEYKYKPSIVAGDFQTSLNYWTLSRIFASDPALNGNFIECKPADTMRIFAVSDPNVDHLYCQVVNNISVIRALPFYGTPSI
jgi:hypothetical protein